MASSLDYITLVTRTSTFYFSESTNNGLNILDQADLRNQILPWQADTWYYQKWLMADDVYVQVHTRSNPATSPKLYICSRNTDINGLPSVITPINLSVAPYLKGVQTLPGNTYTDPDTGIITALDTTLWVFNFNNFSAYITPNEIYYLRLDAYNGTTPYSYYSEPIYLRADKHANTQLYQCTYNANRSGNTNVIITNWYNNYPTNTVPFTPTFTMRCESYVLPLDPKAVNIGYLNQTYQQLQITTQQMPVRTLKIGELCTGIPDYILQMVTEFLLADNIKISGYSYILSGQSSQNAPADMWKSKRDENTPLLKAATVLITKHLSLQFIKTKIPPPCTCPQLAAASITTPDGSSYYGNFTFGLPDGVTCPFTISGVSSFGFPYSFTITSLSDFTSNVGTLYTKRFLIGGLASITYTIRLLSSGTVCNSGNLVYSCTGPTINLVAIGPNGLGGYQSVVQYTNCGTDCHTVSWTYQQLSPATSDTGSFTNTVPCPPGPTFLHTLAPGGAINAGTTISYKFTGTDCCGNVHVYTINYTLSSCICHTFVQFTNGHGETVFASLNPVLGGHQIILCVDAIPSHTCTSYTLSYLQTNSLTSGAPDSGSFVFNQFSDAAGTFSPVTIVHPNPNLAVVESYKYDISITTCCGDVYHFSNIIRY